MSPEPAKDALRDARRRYVGMVKERFKFGFQGLNGPAFVAALPLRAFTNPSKIRPFPVA
jgi:hypothetical protein